MMIAMFQPSNYEEFTSELASDTMLPESAIMLRGSGPGLVSGELVTVDVSGATFSRMTDYRR